MTGGSARQSVLLAPVTRALKCVLCFSDLSPDSKLASKAECADKHLLMGSLFFMVYLVYHQLGTAWHLLSCLLDSDLSVSPRLAKTLGPYEFMVDQFLHIHHNTIHYTEIERYNCQFRSGLRKGVSFGERSGLHIWWWMMVNTAQPLEIIMLSRECSSLGHLYYWCLAFLYYFTFAKRFPVIY